MSSDGSFDRRPGIECLVEENDLEHLQTFGQQEACYLLLRTSGELCIEKLERLQTGSPAASDGVWGE